jgi:hypothetical protein
MSFAIRQSARIRTVATGALALGLVSALWAMTPPQKGGTPKTTFVVAFGPDSKPVSGMTKEEFAVREDGTDRPIVDAKPATDPLDIELIVDTAKMAGSSIADLRTGLGAFAKTIFSASTPVNFSICDSAGSAVLVAENKKSLDDVSKVLEKTFPDQTGNTVILEALNDAATKMGKSTTPRRVIAVVNMDAISEGSSMESQKVLMNIFKSQASLWVVTYQNNDTKNLKASGGAGAAAASKGVTSGGVGTGNVGQSRDFVLEKAIGLAGLRAEIAVPSDLTATLTQVANAINSQYAITYTRPDGQTPKLFQMASTREGVHVLFSQIPVK